MFVEKSKIILITHKTVSVKNEIANAFVKIALIKNKGLQRIIIIRVLNTAFRKLIFMYFF